MYNASLYAALLLGYTIHFIYCIWGNLRVATAARSCNARYSLIAAWRLLAGIQH